ncbi:MAG: haloacid dehalogenase [Desulfurococcaceae archaeon]
MEELVASITNAIACDIEEINGVLKEKDSTRESAIKVIREITRISGSVVNSVHYGKYKEAQALLAKVKELVSSLLELVDPHPDLKYSGLIFNGLSEYVEAYVVYSIVVEGRMPSRREISVPLVPYLQGLGDVVGELRRFVVKLLNEIKVAEAETYLSIMEAIFNNLKALDYPESLIPGVRHKVDVAARLLEDTRVLILNTKNSLRCVDRSGAT